MNIRFMPKLSPLRLETRRQAILEAAERAFARDGFHGTSMQAICREAGISPGTLYLYFPSKDDVFKALVEQRIGVLQGHFDAAAKDQKRDPIAGLRHVARMWATSFQDLRVAALPRIILAEALRFPDLAEFYHRTVIERTQGALVELIQAGIDAGLFRQVEPLLAARALVSPLVFEILRRQAFPAHNIGQPMEDLVEAIFDLFLNGIAAVPSQHSAGVKP